MRNAENKKTAKILDPGKLPSKYRGKIHPNTQMKKPILGLFPADWFSFGGVGSVNSVHTRCIVKTSGFTRVVCENRGFYYI